jgi:hypothetical protein
VDGSETEDDDDEIADLSLKNPARFSEIMATEVCIFQTPCSALIGHYFHSGPPGGFQVA